MKSKKLVARVQSKSLWLVLALLIASIFLMSSCDLGIGHATITVDSYTSKSLSIYADGDYLGFVSGYGTKSFTVRVIGSSDYVSFVAKYNGSSYRTANKTIQKDHSYSWTIY